MISLGSYGFISWCLIPFTPPMNCLLVEGSNSSSSHYALYGSKELYPCLRDLIMTLLLQYLLYYVLSMGLLWLVIGRFNRFFADGLSDESCFAYSFRCLFMAKLAILSKEPSLDFSTPWKWITISALWWSIISTYYTSSHFQLNLHMVISPLTLYFYRVISTFA